MANTIKMTTSQALVKFLDNQYINYDGEEIKFVEGMFTIFGHGIAIGLGEALDTNPGSLKVYQGRNEQGMCHVATAYAKQHNRKKIIPCASSIGPGAANMVTGAATATVNNIPLLVIPADGYANRQPSPVLQEIEQPYNLTVSTNDCFKPVSKYWDKITRPEQLMTAMINAMRVLTDPSDTGAVCISICQDVEGESFDYPDYFFKKRVHRITRPVAVEEEIEDIAQVISQAKNPIVICGGGVKYSEAGETLEKFCEKFNIPFAETQAGKSAAKASHELCTGGVGVCGTLASNRLALAADVVISIGTRMNDFVTGSKSQFQNPDVKFVSINTSSYHAYKFDAVKAVGDAKATLVALEKNLEAKGYKSAYTTEIKDAKAAWKEERQRLADLTYTPGFKPTIEADPRTVEEFVKLYGTSVTQSGALCLLNDILDDDAIVVTAGGSLPSDLERIWETDSFKAYHAEYGYSCMGYEVAATLGAKMAEPTKEAYAFVGDGAFQLLHSEIMTAQQERQKINILLFDNCGFGCINNLQMGNGVDSLCTEFRYRDGYKPSGDLIPIDFAKLGEGYGMKTYVVKTLDELKEAIADSKKQTNSTLIDIKTIPKTMTEGYETFWNIGLADTSAKESVQEAFKDVIKGRAISRLY